MITAVRSSSVFDQCFSCKWRKRFKIKANGANNDTCVVSEHPVRPFIKMQMLFSVFLQNKQSGHLRPHVSAIIGVVRTVAAPACSCVTMASLEGSDVCWLRCCSRSRLCWLRWKWNPGQSRSCIDVCVWYVASHMKFSLNLRVKVTTCYKAHRPSVTASVSWKAETTLIFMSLLAKYFHRLIWFLVETLDWIVNVGLF